MTAINIIKQPDAVHMLTDGASWLYNGEFYSGPPVTKAWQLPHLNSVVATRGPLGSPAILADLIGSAGCSSYDQMKQCASAVVTEAMSYASYADVFQGPLGDKIEVVIAGWSETVGPDAFILRKIDGKLLSADCGPIMMAPGDDAIQKAVFDGLPTSVRAAKDMDPVRDGIAILEAQRASLPFTDRPNGMVTVGAFVLLSTVTATGISSKIIHRWPYTMMEAAA